MAYFVWKWQVSQRGKDDVRVAEIDGPINVNRRGQMFERGRPIPPSVTRRFFFFPRPLVWVIRTERPARIQFRFSSFRTVRYADEMVKSPTHFGVNSKRFATGRPMMTD